jgi:hypothetical protein
VRIFIEEWGIAVADVLGIMSKFGLWRVRPIWWSFADLIVSIPSQGSSGGDTRSEQGELVGSKASEGGMRRAMARDRIGHGIGGRSTQEVPT